MADRTSIPVTVKWIPSRQRILGNEVADRLAHEVSITDNDALNASNTEIRPLLTLANIKHKARDSIQEMNKECWEPACPRRYTDLELKMRPKKPPELYAHLIATRIDHGDFAAYHRRWHHNSANIECVCGREKSVEHPVQ